MPAGIKKSVKSKLGNSNAGCCDAASTRMNAGEQFRGSVQAMRLHIDIELSPHQDEIKWK